MFHALGAVCCVLCLCVQAPTPPRLALPPTLTSLKATSYCHVCALYRKSDLACPTHVLSAVCRVLCLCAQAPTPPRSALPPTLTGLKAMSCLKSRTGLLRTTSRLLWTAITGWVWRECVCVRARVCVCAVGVHACKCHALSEGLSPEDDFEAVIIPAITGWVWKGCVCACMRVC